MKSDPSPTEAPATRSLSILGLLRHQKGWGALSLGLVLLASVMSLLQPLVAGQIVDAVGTRESIVALIVILLVVVAVQVSAESFGNYCQELMGERGALRVREHLGASLMEASFAGLEAYKSGDVAARFTTDAEAIRGGVARGYIQLVNAALTAVGAGILLAVIDWVLLVVVFLIVILAGSGSLVFLSRIEQSSEAKQVSLGGIGTTVTRVFQGMRTIRLFGAVTTESARLRAASALAYDAGRRYAKWGAAVMPAIELAATGSFLAMLIVGGSRVASGQLELGSLISALLYSTILIVPLGALLEAGISLSTASGALRRINELLAVERESGIDAGDEKAEGDARSLPPCESTSQTSPAVSTGEDRAATRYALRVCGLEFEHTPGEKIFTNFSFSLPVGESVLVQGSSGTGKTTLINLICRFYREYAGSLQLFGEEVREAPPGDIHTRVALVEQDSPVLYGTVREALTYGKEEMPDSALTEILGKLGLLDRLGGADEALDRIIGEQGAGMSGGERQRLAVARALLCDRPLIIMDEPTSNLDLESRDVVIEALRDRRPSQSLLIVSHDREASRWTDHCVTLDEFRARDESQPNRLK